MFDKKVNLDLRLIDFIIPVTLSILLLSGCAVKSANTKTAAFSSTVKSSNAAVNSSSVVSQNTASQNIASSGSSQGVSIQYVGLVQDTKNYSLKMLSSKCGWRSSDSGIYTTADGGITWNEASRSFWNDGIQSVKPFFINKQTAYVFVSETNSENQRKSHFYYTKNKGRSWSDLKTSGYNADMLWFDGAHGCVVNIGDAYLGDEIAEVSLTNDGAKSWKLVDKKLIIGRGLGELVFTDSKHGYGFFGQNQDTSYDLQVTSDGGVTWKRTNVGVYDDKKSSGSIMLYPVLFSQNTRFSMLIYENQFVFLDLNSNGKAGKIAAKIPNQSTLSDKTVSFITPSDGYWINHFAHPTLVHYHNGSAQNISQQSWMNEVIELRFTSERDGFALCKNTLYKTADGGKTWAQSAMK